MKFLVLLILEVIYIHNVNSLSVADEVGPVIFVNLIWRHGERTPANFYANDPYQDEAYWPEGLGQLTNAGKRQHYELGQWLRRRYDTLLTDEFSPDRVYVQSTDVDRTIMSAQVNLAGMYPPRDRQVWDKRLPWQPIPVHTTPEQEDKVVMAAKVPCPAYDQEFDRVSKSEEIKQVYKKYQDVVDAVRENAGGDIFDFKYIHDTWDALTIEKRSGYDLPKWAKEILPRMYPIARYRFTIETWTKKLCRLKSGLLIREMIENMRNRTEHRSRRVVNIYSAHDVTLANLLNTLGVYDGDIPPYAACVMLELRMDKHGKHYVTLFYRNSTTDDPHLLTVPACAAVCALDEFISLAQPLIPDDWDKECQSS